MLRSIILKYDIRAVQPFKGNDGKIYTMALIDGSDLVKAQLDPSVLWTDEAGHKGLPVAVSNKDGKPLVVFEGAKTDKPQEGDVIVDTVGVVEVQG